MLILLKLTNKYQTHALIIECATVNKECDFLVTVWDDLARAPQQCFYQIQKEKKTAQAVLKKKEDI